MFLQNDISELEKKLKQAIESSDKQAAFNSFKGLIHQLLLSKEISIDHKEKIAKLSERFEVINTIFRNIEIYKRSEKAIDGEIIDKQYQQLKELYDVYNSYNLEITVNKSSSAPLKVFISYSHNDKYWKNELIKQFRSMIDIELIQIWHDGMIEVSSQWNERIKQSLNESNVVIFLVSPDLLNSEYIRSYELPFAESLFHQKKVEIIPIFIRHIDIEGNTFERIQGLPNGGYDHSFLSDFLNHDKGLYQVAMDLKKFFKKLKDNRIC